MVTKRIIPCLDGIYIYKHGAVGGFGQGKDCRSDFPGQESKISGNSGESEDTYCIEPADVCGGKPGEGGGRAGVDGREWDDEAETSVVCEGVSFRRGEGDGDGVWVEKA